MNFLSIFVLIPVLMIIALFIARNRKQVLGIMVTGSTLLVIMAVYLTVSYITDRAAGATGPMLYTASMMWYEPLNIHYSVGVDGIPVARLRLLLLILLALVVTAAMKVVGVLLITALLVIPAAVARRLARTPEQMAIGASLIGGTAVMSGLAGSLQWNLPLGPAIVVAAATMFALATLVTAGQGAR